MSFESIVLQASRSMHDPVRSGARGAYQNPRVSLERRPTPHLTAGHVLLEVCSVTICGTDVHVLQTDDEGYSCSSVPAANWEAGIQFGHEAAARVIAIGPDVQNVAIGDYVTVDSLIPCRRQSCRTCRVGLWNACPNARLLGLQADGVFGERALVPAASVHSMQPLISRYGTSAGLQFASLAEPLGVALHAYSEAQRWSRSSRPQVMIHGAGAIGLFLACKARLAGAERVIVSEPDACRAERARKVADDVVHPSEVQQRLASDAFRGGPDIVFDACGRIDVNAVVADLAPGGVLLSIARNGQKLCVDGDQLMTNGQAIIGARGHVGHLPEAIDLLAQSEVDPELFITRSLDGLTQLYELLRDTRQLAGELKVACRVSSAGSR